MTEHEIQLIKQLDALRIEHRRLDETIYALGKTRPEAELEIIRLKKQKLGIKDKILQLEGQLYPDIIA